MSLLGYSGWEAGGWSSLGGFGADRANTEVLWGLPCWGALVNLGKVMASSSLSATFVW